MSSSQAQKCLSVEVAGVTIGCTEARSQDERILTIFEIDGKPLSNSSITRMRDAMRGANYVSSAEIAGSEIICVLQSSAKSQDLEHILLPISTVASERGRSTKRESRRSAKGKRRQGRTKGALGTA